MPTLNLNLAVTFRRPLRFSGFQAHIIATVSPEKRFASTHGFVPPSWKKIIIREKLLQGLEIHTHYEATGERPVKGSHIDDSDSFQELFDCVWFWSYEFLSYANWCHGTNDDGSKTQAFLRSHA